MLYTVLCWFLVFSRCRSGQEGYERDMSGPSNVPTPIESPTEAPNKVSAGLDFGSEDGSLPLGPPRMERVDSVSSLTGARCVGGSFDSRGRGEEGKREREGGQRRGERGGEGERRGDGRGDCATALRFCCQHRDPTARPGGLSWRPDLVTLVATWYLFSCARSRRRDIFPARHSLPGAEVARERRRLLA